MSVNKGVFDAVFSVGMDDSSFRADFAKLIKDFAGNEAEFKAKLTTDRGEFKRFIQELSKKAKESGIELEVDTSAFDDALDKANRLQKTLDSISLKSVKGQLEDSNFTKNLFKFDTKQIKKNAGKARELIDSLVLGNKNNNPLLTKSYWGSFKSNKITDFNAGMDVELERLMAKNDALYDKYKLKKKNLESQIANKNIAWSEENLKEAYRLVAELEALQNEISKFNPSTRNRDGIITKMYDVDANVYKNFEKQLRPMYDQVAASIGSSFETSIGNVGDLADGLLAQLAEVFKKASVPVKVEPKVDGDEFIANAEKQLKGKKVKVETEIVQTESEELSDAEKEKQKTAATQRLNVLRNNLGHIVKANQTKGNAKLKSQLLNIYGGKLDAFADATEMPSEEKFLELAKTFDDIKPYFGIFKQKQPVKVKVEVEPEIKPKEVEKKILKTKPEIPVVPTIKEGDGQKSSDSDKKSILLVPDATNFKSDADEKLKQITIDKTVSLVPDASTFDEKAKEKLGELSNRKSILDELNPNLPDSNQDERFILSANKRLEIYNKIIEQLTEYIRLQEVVKSGNKSYVSEHFLESGLGLRNNGSVSQAAVKRALDFYNSYGKEDDSTPTTSLEIRKDILAAYVANLHDAEKAEQIFGKKNKDLFTEIISMVNKATEASEAYAKSNELLSEVANSFAYLIPNGNTVNMSFKERDKFSSILKTDGIEAALKYVTEILKVEIPSAADKAEQAISEVFTSKKDTKKIDLPVNIVPEVDILEFIRSAEQQLEGHSVKVDVATSDTLLSNPLDDDGQPKSAGTLIVGVEPNINVAEFEALAQAQLGDAAVTIGAEPNVNTTEFKALIDAQLASVKPEIDIRIKETGVTDVTSEIANFKTLEEKLQAIIQKLLEKNKLIKAEESIVGKAIPNETRRFGQMAVTLDTLLDRLLKIADAVKKIDFAGLKLPDDLKASEMDLIKKAVKDILGKRSKSGSGGSVGSGGSSSVDLTPYRNILKYNREIYKIEELIAALEANPNANNSPRVAGLREEIKILEEKIALEEEDIKNRNLDSTSEGRLARISIDEQEAKLTESLNEELRIQNAVFDENARLIIQDADNKKVDAEWTEKQRIAYEELNAELDRYNILKKREASGKSLSGDDVELEAVEGNIQAIRNRIISEGLIDSKKERDFVNKRNNIELNLRDIRNQKIADDHKKENSAIDKEYEQNRLRDINLLYEKINENQKEYEERKARVASNTAWADDLEQINVLHDRILEDFEKIRSINSKEEESQKYISAKRKFDETDNRVKYSTQKKVENQKRSDDKRNLSDAEREQKSSLKKANAAIIGGLYQNIESDLKEYKSLVEQIAKGEADVAGIAKKEEIYNRIFETLSKIEGYENQKDSARYNKAINDLDKIERDGENLRIKTLKERDGETRKAQKKEAIEAYKLLQKNEEKLAKKRFELNQSTIHTEAFSRLTEEVRELEQEANDARRAIGELFASANDLMTTDSDIIDARHDWHKAQGKYGTTAGLGKFAVNNSVVLDYESKSKTFRSASEMSATYNNMVDEVKAKIAELKKLTKDGIVFDENADLEHIKTLKTEIDDLFKSIKNSGNDYELAGNDSIEKLRSYITASKNRNSGALDFVDRYDELLDRLAKKPDRRGLREITADFKELEVDIANAGQAGLSFFDLWKKRVGNIGLYLTSFFSFWDIVNKMRQMLDITIDLNTQMIELSKVSNTTMDQLDSRFDSFADSAKDLGATISDTISATADWSRLGHEVDVAQELAEAALIYKNVGDGIDIDTANKSLVSTMQGFELNVSDAMEVIDKFNEVANNFPIDSAGIGEALQRSAASFHAANTDLSKSIALIAGTNAVVQDPDSVGTMWRTVSMRIRGAKAELEAAGEETDGMVESTSQLRDLVLGMTGFDIMEDDNTFKDIYEIIIGIGKEWKNLSDIDRASLLEKLAGKMRSNSLAAALNNIEMIEEAYSAAENSAGSAMAEQERYEQSLQYSLDRFSAATENLSHTLLESGIVDWFVDLGTAGVDALESIIDATGPLSVAFTGLGGLLGSQGLGLTNYVTTHNLRVPYYKIV